LGKRPDAQTDKFSTAEPAEISVKDSSRHHAMSEGLIAIVGVCAAGKTMLAGALCARGFNVREVAQEHSYVPYLWQRVVRPDLLIYLDAGLETIRRRCNDPDWPEWLLEQQIARLRHARENCDLYVRTDDLAPDEVLARTLAWLGE
jgi:hypothetical protein